MNTMNNVDFISCIIPRGRQGRITAYLVLTVVVMLLEFVYGYITNSLGLISDSFHMLLDALSLLIGLCATYISGWPPNKENPFGFARYEVICSFINGILLLFIAFAVMVESVERIVSTPEIDGPYLFHVAFVGLLVNIIGFLFFHDSCSHSHGSHSDQNLRAIYLHILADLLGSISVLISTVALSYGFRLADPICSGFTSVLIGGSAISLIRETGSVLLLVGEQTCSNLSDSIALEVRKMTSITFVDCPQIWVHSTPPRFLVFCSVFAKLDDGANYHKCKADITCIVQKKIYESLGAQTRAIVHLEC